MLKYVVFEDPYKCSVWILHVLNWPQVCDRVGSTLQGFVWGVPGSLSPFARCDGLVRQTTSLTFPASSKLALLVQLTQWNHEKTNLPQTTATRFGFHLSQFSWKLRIITRRKVMGRERQREREAGLGPNAPDGHCQLWNKHCRIHTYSPRSANGSFTQMQLWNISTQNRRHDRQGVCFHY